jgi:uncharacterized protein (TIGR02171 family)
MASLDEKPGMQSSFTYDYWLDSTEVTQKQFFDCTGRRPVSDSSQYGLGDNYPVYFVTWFDAVLYSNSRSKTENLDTVYVYFSKKIISNGRVYELTGLREDLSKDGYRLPTEAEWEFAARGGSSALPFSKASDSTLAQNSVWFSANSMGGTHPVATKLPNSLGLYDMAGNVFEWTNDWKTFYTGQPITNSEGAEQANDQFEKVMKGGSFNYGYQSLRPSIRSATYSTTLSSASEYVGFRCARGSIPAGAYIAGDTASLLTNPVDLLVSDVQSFLGTSNARLIFVNEQNDIRTLCYVNYNSPHPSVCEFKDMRTVYCPTISPDGRYVAFATRDEGLYGPSNVYIRDLDSSVTAPIKIPGDSCYVPRWWVDATANDTFLVYVNSAVDNALPLWYSTVTFKQQVAGGKPVGARQIMISGGGFHDGISHNGNYATTGYTKLLMYGLTTQETRQIFVYPFNGKNASGSTQVCNVSISPDRIFNDRCLFLDFGYPGVSSITGCSYRIHEYLFMSEFSGQTLAWFYRPADASTWEDVEWSNVYRFAVASSQESSGAMQNVYIIDLLGGIFLKVVHGIEIRQPGLWVTNVLTDTLGLSIDSLGAYNDPPLDLTQALFASRMHFFWPVCDSIQYAFVGSSHTAQSIDPHAFRQRRVYNLAYSMCDPPTTCSMIRNYILNHCRNIKFIGIDFLPYFLGLPNGMNNHFATALQISKGYQYDSLKFFWKAGLSNFTKLALTNKPYTIFSNMDSLNLESAPCGGWGGDNPSVTGGAGWDTTSPNYEANMAIWESLILELNGLGIEVLFYITPESPAFAANGFFGPVGPSLETGKEIVAHVKQLETKYPLFHLYDAYQFGNHDYTNSDASDPDHLCAVGAWKFSTRLDSVISTFMPY